MRLLPAFSKRDGAPPVADWVLPLLPKCFSKLANGCHESYDSRLHFVCVRCVALHFRDHELRIKFRKMSK